MATTQFTAIKQYILLKGHRQTYCNMYNNNPHLAFGTRRHAYLIPSVGPHNMNCDPEKSDFNTIVIQDWSSTVIYYRVRMNDDGQTIIFDPPDSKTLFDELYHFVHENNS